MRHRNTPALPGFKPTNAAISLIAFPIIVQCRRTQTDYTHPKHTAMTKSKAAVPDQLTALILLSYPALLLTVQGGMSGMFILLLLISLYSLFRSPKIAPHWDACAIAFALAMASPVIAIFLSQAYHGAFRAPPYDWAARFLFAIPIFLALRQMNLRSLSMLQYGIPVGVLSDWCG